MRQDHVADGARVRQCPRGARIRKLKCAGRTARLSPLERTGAAALSAEPTVPAVGATWRTPMHAHGRAGLRVLACLDHRAATCLRLWSVRRQHARTYSWQQSRTSILQTQSSSRNGSAHIQRRQRSALRAHVLHVAVHYLRVPCNVHHRSAPMGAAQRIGSDPRVGQCVRRH